MTRRVAGMLAVDIVGMIDNKFVVVMGSWTFVIATMGINIFANFVSPACDIANMFPKQSVFVAGAFSVGCEWSTQFFKLLPENNFGWVIGAVAGTVIYVVMMRCANRSQVAPQPATLTELCGVAARPVRLPRAVDPLSNSNERSR